MLGSQVFGDTLHRQPIAVSDISVYICLIDISFRSKSKEQLNERRAGLSNLIMYYSLTTFSILQDSILDVFNLEIFIFIFMKFLQGSKCGHHPKRITFHLIICSGNNVISNISVVAPLWHFFEISICSSFNCPLLSQTTAIWFQI